MNKTEVKSKLKIAETTIESLEKQIKENPVAYLTRDKFLEGVGYIEEISTIEDIILAQKKINILSVNQNFVEEIKELGLSTSEIPEMEEVQILGFMPKHWKTDISNRLSALRLEIKLNRFIEARDVLKNYLSEEDKFSIDTDELDDLFKGEELAE